MPLKNERPSPELMRELEEVAEKAGLFQGFLRNANFLPREFPTEQTEQELIALTHLPQGTAEGCKEPLLLARRRLMQLRRTYIAFHDQSADLKEPDTPPATTRGTSLDVRISELYASVGTALEQYQSEARADIEDEPTVEPVVERVRGNAFGNVVGRSRELEETLDSAKRQFDDISIGNSENADNLRRLLTDAENENRLLRAELEMPSTRLGWLTPLRNRLAKAPEFIEGATRILRVGVDVSRKLYWRFHGYVGDGATFLFDQINLTLDTIDEVTAIIKEARDGPKSDNTPPPDFDIRSAERMILHGEAPPKNWIPFLNRLSFQGSKLEDLSPLRDLTALDMLILNGTDVSDLLTLSNLTALRQLSLRNTPVFDVSALSSLKALESLTLNGTRISDVSALSNLTTLELLVLNGTQVSDISALSNLTALKLLDLRGTSVSDVSALSSLTALKHLSLASTQIMDVSPLSSLTALESLQLQRTQVSDVSALSSLRALKSLNLERTDVSDVSALSNLTTLETLVLNGTLVSDVSPLDKLVANHLVIHHRQPALPLVR